jgi:hypothetical protein
VLTQPSAGVKNDGLDNEACDLILGTGDVLVSPSSGRYVVLDLLGAGTFGQVVAARHEGTGAQVAIKVRQAAGVGTGAGVRDARQWLRSCFGVVCTGRVAQTMCAIPSNRNAAGFDM